MVQHPILFLVFNRPATTARVFEKIKEARPAKLYIAADGPRAHVPADVEKCAATRAVVQNIDWPCQVFTRFRDANMGCRNAVSDAITWFFEQEEAGIILEDDCLPHPDFFPFMDELLVRYGSDQRVWHISGNNFLLDTGLVPAADSYYASRIAHIWGWATWRRAWNHYNVNLPQYPDYVAGKKKWPYISALEKAAFSGYVEAVATGKQDTWDFQWVFTILEHNGLCLNPAKNLVSNIGYGADGTHAHDQTHYLANLPTYAILPLQHPAKLVHNRRADVHLIKRIFYKGPIQRLKWKLKQTLKSWLS